MLQHLTTDLVIFIYSYRNKGFLRENAKGNGRTRLLGAE